MLAKNRIKTYKNQYNLAEKLRLLQSQQFSASSQMNETSQNPYIGSNEETSLPSNTKKNTSKQIDPKGDYFGLKTDPDERFN